MVDLFDEVEEQLRSERYLAMARKAAPYAIGTLLAALLAALGIWGWDSYQKGVAAKASDAYAAALVDRENNQDAKADAAFKAISTTGPKAYRALALMELGGHALAQNDPKGAAILFDQAAATGAEMSITDAARLKSAFALMDTATYAESEARLKVLAADDRPYRSVAKEALAFAKLQKGDMAAARVDFNALSLAIDSSEDLRQRAGRVIQLIDAGTAKSMPQAAKAALALPTAPIIPQFSAGAPQ